jgi:nitrate/TMAO reductase-like tetraheme cytochrome c subunit
MKISMRTVGKTAIMTLFMFAVVNSIMIATSANSGVAERDISCFHCHSAEVGQFQKSVHYTNISCIDCHGGDTSVNGTLVSIDVMYKNFTGIPSKVNITKLCSKCHSKTVGLYEESVHWNRLISGRENAPSCMDCHGTHNILSHKDPQSMTYVDKIPQLCANCHENQTKMQAWYYGIATDRFDTYKKSYHYKATILGGGKDRSLATCNDCHENHNTKNRTDPSSAIYPANLVKTCEKEGCHAGQSAQIYGGNIHEGQSVYLSSTGIDLKSLVTYFYVAMILFELSFTFGLIGLGIYSQIDIRKRGHNKEHKE